MSQEEKSSGSYHEVCPEWKRILLWSDIISHLKGVILNIIYLIPCWSNLWKLPCDNDKPNKYLKPQKNPKLNQGTVLLRNFTECYNMHWTSTKWKFELQKIDVKHTKEVLTEKILETRF